MKKITKDYLPVIVIALMGLVILGLIGSSAINKVEEEKIVIYFPKIADFPNTEEGAVIFEFNFPSVGFKVGEQEADILMFLNSETIPGIAEGKFTGEPIENAITGFVVYETYSADKWIESPYEIKAEVKNSFS